MCQTRHYTALLQLLHQSASPSDTLYVKKFHKQSKPVLHFQKHISISALYVRSLSLALILFYSFCEEKYIKSQAAQEILFRLVIAQSEGRESERQRSFSD